ncbi:DNA adenine methylase [Corynebacterium sanguinis]|uniref:DNA adenine methylase n=1 Tax=Corynebacterium sanguinis TaxID=2594913 RepID=UPI001B8602FD|nr:MULTISPECIES: DNA adenine methylase [Actinomycetes]MCT1425403.1 DNA adenine methylase [Corynebacterium sanguinis]MCT1628094.1 DNA adenine methylase [Corynebacterium sanguinis]MCT1694574.1 DNA adenine methylase [Corynebacterium sanguinis]MCT1713983.1 DNA adenine methylase [Corynebacterium sanguinis]MCT2020001.1 DNA adenine methylase [Kocuria marina]
MYSRLRKMIRDMDLAGCTYVEPYAGGVGAGLSLLVTGQVERVVINDLDPAIHAFWTTVQSEPGWLIERIHKAKLDVTEWRRQREIYVAADTSDLSQLGFATFYLNRTNRSGVLNGGPIGGLDQTGNYKIDARFNRDGLAERIRILSLYADNIVPTSRDGIEVIAEYAPKDDVFIYADPPYFEKAGSLYLNAFSATDHEDLARVLNSVADRPWILTYDNAPQVAELYAARRRREFELHYSAHRVGKATEVAVLSESVPEIGQGWPLTPTTLT